MEESDGGTEQIVGADISLEYVPGDELQKLVKGQENFLWLKTLWDHPELKAKVGVKYDETALAEQIAGLACLVPENQVASVNAHPEFNGTQFEIVPEVVGTQINTEVFNEAIRTKYRGISAYHEPDRDGQLYSAGLCGGFSGSDRCKRRDEQLS